jgi:N utilization substance protein A
MNRDLIHIIEQMSKERGIPKESILGTLEAALLSAVRKKHGIDAEINISIDSTSGSKILWRKYLLRKQRL